MPSGLCNMRAFTVHFKSIPHLVKLGAERMRAMMLTSLPQCEQILYSA
jgi:hypothetical protein